MQSKKFNWTHKSIVRSIGTEEPIKYIEDKTRKIVLDALDQGWSGPPFNPIDLAKRLGISVVPNASLQDARIFADDNGDFVIEYNPNRSRGRQRFSIAHEIAHTFFPDCADEIRNRESVESISGDVWQLEMLCNIGAAEMIMPIGSYGELLPKVDSLKDILEHRKFFDVSTEAMLIRYAKLTSKKIAVFCASRSNNDVAVPDYKIDYLIPSSSWPYEAKTGDLLADCAPLRECTAIGFMTEGSLSLSGVENSLQVQAVGLPPYPGNFYPRVAGILFSDDMQNLHGRGIRYHEGDAVHPGGTGTKIIAHILNDATPNWGGGGFAVSLKKAYPDVQKKYKDWAISFKEEFHLGNSFLIGATSEISVLNMIAQRGYGPSDFPRIRYSALRDCLIRLSELAIEKGASVHMPRIGVGNAGGRWEVIEELLREILVDSNIEVNVYDLPGKIQINEPEQLIL